MKSCKIKVPSLTDRFLHIASILWIQTVKKSHSLIHKAFFGTFKVKIGPLYSSPQSMFENCDFSQFRSKIVQMSILKTNFGVNYQPIFAPKMSKEAIWTGLWHSFIVSYSWYLNNVFIKNSGPFNIKLLQCSIVLWIHSIDGICRCRWTT